MIVKSISHTLRKSPTELIKYIFDGRKPLLDPEGNPLYFKRNVRSYDKDKWKKSFNQLEQNRQSHYGNKSVVAYHEVISFHPESTKHLNRALIKDLVNRYIELRCNDQIVVGGTHFEADGKNWHTHLIFSGIKQSDGRSARISQARFEAIKKELQKYQMEKYPEISDSVVEHGRKKKD
ncbi:MAG: hypothetical protein AAF489_03540 [Bacteroidota bacterium]